MARFWQFYQLSDAFRSMPSLSPIPLPAPTISTAASSRPGSRPPPNSALFIGGVAAFATPTARATLAAHGITHVLSVLDWDPAPEFPLVFGGDAAAAAGSVEAKVEVAAREVVQGEEPQTGASNAALSPLRCLYLAAEDRPEEDLLRLFPRACTFVDEAWGGGTVDGGERAGGGVLVHCAMGVSRSATLACAVLMWNYGLDAAAALTVVRAGREWCRPNEGFRRQLEVWGRMLKVKSEEERRVIYERWKAEEESKPKM